MRQLHLRADEEAASREADVAPEREHELLVEERLVAQRADRLGGDPRVVAGARDAPVRQDVVERANGLVEVAEDARRVAGLDLALDALERAVDREVVPVLRGLRVEVEAELVAGCDE